MKLLDVIREFERGLVSTKSLLKSLGVGEPSFPCHVIGWEHELSEIILEMNFL